MLDAGGGKIINVTSEFGLDGEPYAVHYATAKGGVISMTRALAKELGPSITVNAIAPGPIETDMLAESTEEWRMAKKESLPLGRFGTVEDVAPTAVFLASDDGDYYTGQVLSPDGGSVMH